MEKIRSIADINKQSVGEIFGMYLRSPWYFETITDKIVLVGIGILAMLKIYGWIF